jgi:hypothetical protein
MQEERCGPLTLATTTHSQEGEIERTLNRRSSLDVVLRSCSHCDELSLRLFCIHPSLTARICGSAIGVGVESPVDKGFGKGMFWGDTAAIACLLACINHTDIMNT